jgi:hypothetical protein
MRPQQHIGPRVTWWARITSAVRIWSRAYAPNCAEVVFATEDDRPLGFAYGYTMTPDMPRWQKLVQPFAQNLDELAHAALKHGRIFT